MSAPDTPGGGGRDSGTRERLQRISRHFLSDEGATRRIAVLTDPGEPHHLPPEGLARALAGLGRSVVVVDTAAGLISLTHPDPAAGSREFDLDPERVLSRLRGSHPCDILIVRSPHPADAGASCDLALLAVPVHARGMRSAYLRLKELARQDHVPAIGITLTDAQDRAEAAAAFARFAGAAQRFLDIRVTSYSYLATAAGRGGTGGNVTGATLDDIARLLLEDGRRQDRQTHAGVEPAAAMPRNLFTKGQA